LLQSLNRKGAAPDFVGGFCVARNVVNGRRNANTMRMPFPRFRDVSIRNKVMLVTVSACLLALLSVVGGLYVFQLRHFRKTFGRELQTLARIMVENGAGALALNDPKTAGHILAPLAVKPEIRSAKILGPGGEIFATFGRADESSLPNPGDPAGTVDRGASWTVVEPIQRDGKRIGTFFLEADFAGPHWELQRMFFTVTITVLGVSLLLVVLLTTQFQKVITRPIQSLASASNSVARDHDYSVRVARHGDDEVGMLTDAFNQMLAQIQSQDTALKGARGKVNEQLKSLQREMAERVRAEKATARLTAIIDGTPDFVGTADPTGRVLYLNPAARRMLGIETGAAISPMMMSDFHPGWAARIVSTEGIPEAIHDGSWAGETAIRHQDGREIHVSQVIIAHKTPGGGLEHLSTVMRDISERRAAEEALNISQQKLLETSRMAGMAEVATGVLHNVGNVLNSVNVSSALVLEKLRRSKASKVGKAAELLIGRNGSLAEYLTQDPNGQKLPGYLAKLGQHLVEENADMLGEVDQLSRNIEHIKEVVAMQQNYAKVSGVFEDLDADRLVEDAIAMNIGAFERHGVTLERRFSAAPRVRVDRHRVLQILINLIRNAKYALDDVKRPDKRLTISIEPAGGKSVRVIVADNGVGISAENLTRVFGHGFTTRKDGHGFGLHSGANAAKEMGGALTVHSAGEGRGAAFTLELPVASAEILP
jgi:PAS domain S-box-containing protein